MYFSVSDLWFLEETTNLVLILPQDSPGPQGKYYLSLTSTEIEEDVERNMDPIMQR